jgi:hypothetical protein
MASAKRMYNKKSLAEAIIYKNIEPQPEGCGNYFTYNKWVVEFSSSILNQ